MRTVVIQSYRTENVAEWIARCMESVRLWTHQQGFDYQFADDSSFALCGTEYLARVGRNMRSITNLSRLELIREAHRNGYERAIWLDADVLVFRPDLLTVDVTEGYAFAAETWIETTADNSWTAIRGTNNSAIVCMRGEPDLDFLIAATRHIARHRHISSNFQVGGDLIKGLHKSLGYAVLDDIGMFSKHVVRALANGNDRLIAMQAIEHGTPVFAANLCASDHYKSAPSQREADNAVEALLSSGGDIVNRWLLKSQRNLRDGQLHKGMARLFPVRDNIATQFRQMHGYDLNFENPQTFNERIAARKHLLTDQIFRDTADKFAARTFVSDRLGGDVLIPLLQVCERGEDLDFESLPSAFILKSTHASGWNHIVRDKDQTNASILRDLMRSWLGADFSSAFFEAQYEGLPRRVLVEPLLVNEKGFSPEDYRFYVFGGRVGLVGANVWSASGLLGSLFDRGWRRLDVTYSRDSAGAVPPPSCLNEMIAAAETLGRDFPFVRIDLYCHAGKMLFGEITHSPNGGGGKFNPPEFDAVLGSLWGQGEPIPERFFVGAFRPVPLAAAPRINSRKPKEPQRATLPARYELNARLMQFNPLSNLNLRATAAVGEIPKNGGQQIEIEIGSAPQKQTGAFVSCLMVTKNRFRQAQLAVQGYRRQSWRKRELLVLDSSDEEKLVRWIEDLRDPTIRVIHTAGSEAPLGAHRNRAVELAEGTHVAQWDDDDLSHPARLEAQLSVLKQTRSRANLLCRELLWMPRARRMSVLQFRSHENTLLCERAAMPRYPELPRAEDTPLVKELIATKVVSYLDLPELYLYVAHGANTFDETHMRSILAHASFVFPDYTNALAQLSRCFPLREYQAAIASLAEPERIAPAGAA
jgi:hypothetical protein